MRRPTFSGTPLSHERARRIYDRIGSLQDTQAFYEDPATDLLLRHGRFSYARQVFEFGCGTGRFAARLFAQHLGVQATYRGVDLSPKMVELVRRRLAPFGDRASVASADGGPPVQEPAAAYDRFVSTYVLDLLSVEEMAGVLREAHRLLVPGGLLCLCSLSTGSGPASRAVATVWSAVYRVSPRLTGGCRPLELLAHVDSTEWKVVHEERVAPFAIPSEIVVAERV